MKIKSLLLSSRKRKILLTVFLVLNLIFITPLVLLLCDDLFARLNTSLSTTSDTDSGICIVTYNIHQFWLTSDSEIMANKFLNLFTSIDADIIGLQEAWGAHSETNTFDVPWFAKQLNMSFATTPEYSNGIFYGLGILTKYPILGVNITILKEDPSFTRSLLWANLKTPFGNITVFNTHLDTFLYQSNQINQTRSILSITDSYSPSIFIGDFNIPDSIFIESYRMLTENLEDVWIGSGYASFAGRTWPASNPLLRVDYIFVEGGNWEIIKDRTTLIGDNSYSDHLGIKSELALITNEQSV